MHLIERDAPLNELRRAQAEVAADSGRIVLIRGEAGIGKTALVEHFVRSQVSPWRVILTACDNLFSPRPLGPFYDFATQIQGELARHLHVGMDRLVFFHACLHELRTPTTLILEDLHWADEATLDLLKYLARRIQHTRCLLIATYRDDELALDHPLRTLLGDLVTGTFVRRIPLSPLSLAGVRQLVGARTLDTHLLHRQTGGNPFFLTEIQGAEPGNIPATVQDAVLARAARLTVVGRTALQAAAVLGPRIEPWLLTAIAQTDAVMGSAHAIDEVLTRGFLVAQGDSFIFRHELVRQTILDALAPHRRIALHQQALDLLRRAPAAQADPTRLAHHAVAAGDRSAILAYVPPAAVAARHAGMFRTAASLWEVALDHARDLPAKEQSTFYEDYALSLRTHPDKARSLLAYRRALELAHQAGTDQIAEGRLLVRMATMYIHMGDTAAAEQLTDDALARLAPLSPTPPLALAYKNQANLRLIQGNYPQAVVLAEQSVLLAQQLSDRYIHLSAAEMLGRCWLPVDHARGCALLEQTLDAALEHGGYWRASSLYPNLIIAYLDVYQLRRAEDLITVGTLFTTEHDMTSAHLAIQSCAGTLDLLAGRWAAAADRIESLTRYPQSELQPSGRSAALLAAARLQVRRDVRSADRILDEARDLAHKADSGPRLGYVYAARAEAAWLAGDLHRCAAEARIPEMQSVGRQPGIAAELTYWRWRAGEAVETFDWMLQPFVLEIQGDWRSAARLWAELGCPYEEARALMDGDTDAQLAALAICEKLGAQSLIHWLHQRLQSVGIRRRGPQSTTVSNPFGLTNRQVEILRLLAQDLTNREIADRLSLSAKTVDHHVSAILAKLQVTSRAQAAAIARHSSDL